MDIEVSVPTKYTCTLVYEGDFAPGEKRELRPARITAEERVAPERLVVFRGEDLIVSEAHEAFWIADILAYEAKGTSRTVSQLPDMVVREGGLPAATFLATSQHGGFLLDTCAPNNFALVVENRGSAPAKFSAVVVGKAITK